MRYAAGRRSLSILALRYFRWLDKQFNACSTRASVQVGVGSIASRIQARNWEVRFAFNRVGLGDVHDTSALLLMADILREDR